MSQTRLPLRLLVVGSRWPAESFLERLFRGLADENLQIWMALKELVEPDHPYIHHLPVPTPGLFSSTLRRIKGAKARESDLRPFLRGQWDLLYFPWNSAAVTFLPLMRSGIPSIVSCRGSQILIAPHVPGREALTDRFPEMFRLASAVHCVSNDILEASVALGLDPSKAHVVTPAVDEQRFCPASAGHPRPNGPIQIVGLGSLIWRKGFEDALVALAKLRDQGIDFRYRLIGDGPDRQRLLFTARDLDLEKHVIFEGSQTPSEILLILQQSDIFLLSSVCEGISNAALEAMACGLPVVSTRCGGMAEALTDGCEGFLVPARNPEAMAAALGRLAEDSVLRDELGRAARKRIELNFRLQDQINAFRRLCFETAGHRIS